MVASAASIDKQFWSLVWPQLKAGAWRCELQPQPPTLLAATAAAAAGGDAADHISDEGADDVVAADAGCSGSSSSNSSNNASNSLNTHLLSPTSNVHDNSSNTNSSRGINGVERSRGRSRRDSAAPVSAVVEGGPAAAAAAAALSPPPPPPRPPPLSTAAADLPASPVFYPPAPGVASEALEEAMRRNLPADGSAGDERLERLEGISAVIELLQQVPGYPGTTSFGTAPNVDAVAAAARAVLVRTPPSSAGSGRSKPAGAPVFTRREVRFCLLLVGCAQSLQYPFLIVYVACIDTDLLSGSVCCC